MPAVLAVIALEAVVLESVEFECEFEKFPEVRYYWFGVLRFQA